MYAFILQLSYASAAELCAKQFPYETISENRCQCGQALNDAKLPAPAGFQLDLVCGLADVNGKEIQIKKRSQDLAEYHRGVFYYSGRVTLKGVIFLDNGGTDVPPSFIPAGKSTTVNHDKFKSEFEDYLSLSRIYFAPKEGKWDFDDVHVDIGGKPKCASATIIIKKFYIFLADTEDTGANTQDYKLSHVGKFRDCPVRH